MLCHAQAGQHTNHARPPSMVRMLVRWPFEEAPGVVMNFVVMKKRGEWRPLKENVNFT